MNDSIEAFICMRADIVEEKMLFGGVGQSEPTLERMAEMTLN
jgi:hypothetical protein